MSRRLHDLLRLPGRALALLLHGGARLHDLGQQLRRASTIGRSTAKTTREIGKRTRKLESSVAALNKDLRSVTGEIRQLREEIGGRLLQYNLQLGRLAFISAATDGNGDQVESSSMRLSGRSVPLEIDDTVAPDWEAVGDRPHPDPEGREWLLLDACPLCGHGERTVVNEWNKLALLRKGPDQTSAQYDFAVCHACGTAYATRRPTGSRYRFLNLNFGEVIAKHGAGDPDFTNPLLNPYPLTDADRETLKRRAASGVFVSEHLGLRSGEYLEGLVKDRFENSVHLDLIGALLSPRNARVLEIRPRTGMISEGLRRLYGADVRAMPIWESQQQLVQEVYGIESLGLVNYDEFEIPGDGMFDLIICNHMLTHAVRPQRFFDAVRGKLTPGGHVYFYNEPDDAEFLSGRQSMLATLNPLHMQAFDQASFRRALAANGLDVIFQRRRNDSHMCLARMLGNVSWSRMTESERSTRTAAYRRARDRAILRAPADIRGRFMREWPQLVQRSVAEGLAEFGADGNLHLVSMTRTDD